MKSLWHHQSINAPRILSVNETKLAETAPRRASAKNCSLLLNSRDQSKLHPEGWVSKGCIDNKHYACYSLTCACDCHNSVITKSRG
jgi:hypothetical protein